MSDDVKIEELPTEELQAELGRLRENLCDLEDQHAFTFVKTSVHIGAERAQQMQEEFDEECSEYKGRIAAIEGELKARGAGAD